MFKNDQMRRFFMRIVAAQSPARRDRFALALSDTGYKRVPRVPSDDSAQSWAGRSHVQQCLSNIFGGLRSFPGQTKRVLKTQRGASAPQKPTNCGSVQKVVLPTMSGH